MHLTPKKIFRDYKENSLDKKSAFEQLSLLVEGSEYIKTRVESLEILAKLSFKDEKFFSLLESLLVSDASEEVRLITAKILKRFFIDRSKDIIQWAFFNETSGDCLNILYDTLLIQLGELKHLPSSVSLLRAEIQKIRDKDFIISSDYQNETSILTLYDRLINYYTISFLKKLFWRLQYKIENGLVVQLDFTFKGLMSFPEPLKYLRSLEILILKYNQITEIPDWIDELSTLKLLDLSHNNIKILNDPLFALKNLEILNLESNYLKSIPNSIKLIQSLQKLNLKRNPLVEISLNTCLIKSLKELYLNVPEESKVHRELVENKHANLKIIFERI
ncbi:MAG: leucine-rich repeat domain-containing protein [Promethearchaeota archaeon]